MNHINKFVYRLFITLFTLSVSVTIIPCSLINVHGLFGEIKSAIVTEDSRTGKEELSTIAKKRHYSSGENVYNIWFVLSVTVTYLIFISYRLRLPREKTIVTLKVRMDN